jgi:hypothetical protein
VFEHLLLHVERAIEARPRVETDLAHVFRLRQVFLPEWEFLSALGDELRMQAERCADVARLLGELPVAGPGLRSGGDRERVDAFPIAFLERGRMVRIEVEVTVEVHEPG